MGRVSWPFVEIRLDGKEIVIPATLSVIPAKAGIHIARSITRPRRHGFPVKPGMTISQQSMRISPNYYRIKASISSAFTGTPRVISSQPFEVTMASSSMRMPMLWNFSGTPSAGRT